MKKTILLIMLCCCLIIGFKESLMVSKNRLADHKDVGSYINVDELNLNNLTMLHFYSSEMTLESNDNNSVDFVRFDLVSPLSIYINKSIVIQNYLEEYKGYTDKKYIRYSVNESDYINNNATTYIEIEPTPKNKYATFFVGSYERINDLIVNYHVIKIGIYFLLVVSLILLLLCREIDKWLIIYLLSYLVLMYDFDYGLVTVTICLYLMNNQLIYKGWRIYLIIIMTGCSLFFVDYTTIILISGLLQVYSYYKKQSCVKFTASIAWALLWAVTTSNLEYYLFMIFRKEMYFLILAIVNLVNMKDIPLSKKDTVSLSLLRGINHDLKIPISVLKLNNEMLSNNLFNTEAKKNNIITSSDTAIRELENMVGSISAFVSNKDYISKYYQSSVLESIIKAERGFRIREEKVDFTVERDTEDTLLPIDAIWLDRLIYSLLDNAFKYTKAYGAVKLTYKKEKGFMRLEVEDSGIGMTNEQINNAMEPFYRADDSRSISGLGLGLSIVSNIVYALHGDILIESTYGKGTVIKIRI